MPSVFNILRLCIYLAVIAFSLICLSLSANFQSVLASSDLTRFVPFALFVSVVGLLIVAILLGFSAVRGTRNPISTRSELGGIGLAGAFWLVLAIFLATASSQDADVECFASSTDINPLTSQDASLQTDAFQAMYRVLMVFSFLNAILLLIFCGMMVILVHRRFHSGDEQAMYMPITSFPWFTKAYGNTRLPGPGAQDGGVYTDKPRSRHNKRSVNDRPSGRPPPGAEFFGRSTRRADRFARDASPRRPRK